MNTSFVLRRRTLAALGLAMSPALTTAQDAADPTAAVPEAVYRSAIPPSPSTSAIEPEPLPWRGLFRPDGAFVPEEELATSGRAADAAPRPPDRATAAPGALPPGSDARGTVRSIDRTQGKVKLQHGPIDKFEMPGMTMVFRAADPALLEKVDEGDDVGFTVEQRAGAFVVTGFQRPLPSAAMSAAEAAPAGAESGAAAENPPARSRASDARGTVRSIDPAQGKVKLKHGPIEKFGMPGMSMVFRVAEPSLLEQVDEGDEVGFTVEQRSGAFVITGFQP